MQESLTVGGADAPIPKVADTEAAAVIVGSTASTMEKWRLTGDGPPFIKLGARRVVYVIADLHEWLRSRRRYQSTSDFDRAA